MRYFRAAAAAMSLAVLATGAVAVSASAVDDPNVVYACVKKSNGDVKIVNEAKKCSKGWVKISWNVTGPQGPAGPVGPTRSVFDAKGAIIGTILSASGWGFEVENGGGMYSVATNGVLGTSGIYYLDSKCMGAAYAYFSKWDGFWAAGAGNDWERFVQQTPDKKYWGFAYAGPSRELYLPTKLYYSIFPGGGSCMEDDTVNSGWLFTLKSVPAPQPAVGKVTIK